MPPDYSKADAYLSAMNVSASIDKIKTKEDFTHFLRQLHDDFIRNGKDTWENADLGNYLEAMEAFVTDSTPESLHQIDFTPSWKLFAHILLAASLYE